MRKMLTAVLAGTALMSATAASAVQLTLTFMSGWSVLDSFTFDNQSGVDNLVAGYLYFDIANSLNGNTGMYVGIDGSVGVGLRNGTLPNVDPTVFEAMFSQPFWSGTGYTVTFANGTYNSLNGIEMTVSGAPAIPEPASWALLIAGFGLVGAAMRRRAALRHA